MFNKLFYVGLEENKPFMTRKHLLFLLACCLLFANNLKAQRIYTLAGGGTQGYGGDDSVANHLAVKINTPSQIAVDTGGNIIFADKNNSVVRKVNMHTGIITTIAGNGTAGYSGDGAAATAAQLKMPVGVAVDDTGSIFISDWASHTIRLVSTLGMISTWAGADNSPGFAGDNGPATAAKLNHPMYIAIDKGRHLFVADSSNDIIREIFPNDSIVTVAGTPDSAGYKGDGFAATAAWLYWPTSVAVDTLGNLFIMDSHNNAVRKVNSSGIITSVVGTPNIGYLGWGYTGDGGPATSAQLNNPIDISLDGGGNLFIADIYNDAVRLVTLDGKIKTIAGAHSRGFNGDSNLATNTQFSAITAVRVHNGILYISDSGNARVRYMSLTSLGITEQKLANGNISIAPNPNDGSFSISGNTESGGAATLDVIDMSGKAVLTEGMETSGGAYKKQLKLDRNLPPGLYFIKVTSSSGVSVAPFEKR